MRQKSTKRKANFCCDFNHDTKFTREIYKGAKFKRVKVQRSISQSSEKRVKVKELIAIFKG